MNPHRTYWPLDDTPEPSGDAAFMGVNALGDPGKIAPGEVSMAINARFDEGRASTRPGIIVMPWGAPGVQGDGPGVVRPYGTIRVAEEYQDPYTGEAWTIIVAGDGKTYRTRHGARGIELPIAAGESAAGATDLIQTYNGMVMLRGEDEEPLYLPSLAAGWRPIPDVVFDPQNPKEKLPPATSGIYFGNRLCVVDARQDPEHVDTVWVSDAGGVDSVLAGKTVYQSFRINQGSSDRLTAVAKFNETTIVCAKSKSIYVVSGVSGTNDEISVNAVLDKVTDQYGCVSPRSWVQVGSDLWFMAYGRGVSSIRQTETNALQGVDVPVSRAIQPIIDRINWQASAAIVASAHKNRVYFAVPLDGSATNNAILVYSTLTGKWAGYDMSDATKVADFIKFTYGGEVRQGFAHREGFLMLYEDGWSDHVGSEDGVISYNPIETTVLTRGYLGGSAGTKTFKRCAADMWTWDPEYIVSTRTGGAFESVVRATVTKDRTRYVRPDTAPDWDPTNSNEDWETPFRQDYSSPAPGLRVTSGATGDGIVLWDTLQQTEESWSLKRTGPWLQVEFASTRGRMEIAGVAVESTRGSSRRGSNV